MYILTNYADGGFSTLSDTLLLDCDTMLLERSLSTVLRFLASVRIFQTRNDTSATGIKKINKLTMQGCFEASKHPARFLARKGVVGNSWPGIIKNTFVVGVIAEHIRGVGLNNRLFLLFLIGIHAGLARGVGIRALTFQLLNDLTRMLLRGLRSIRVRDGSLFEKGATDFKIPSLSSYNETLETNLVATNNVSGRHDSK